MPLVHPRQHVLQRVAALVEERLHLVERHQRRRGGAVGVDDRRRLVADHVSYRQTNCAAHRRERARARAHLVHPGAASLLLSACKGVEEDVCGGHATALQLEEAHVRVPHLRADIFRCALDHGDAEETRDDAKETLEDSVEGEVLAHRLRVVRVLHLLELLSVVVHVPKGEGAACKLLEVCVLLARRTNGLDPQIFEKIVCLLKGGHLGRQADLGVRGAAEKRRLLAAELQDAADPGSVVVATKLGGSRNVRLVHRLAKRGVVSKSQHRD
mmetsp:Transcript_29148/g.68223  ORF Transcript_29148/g.68223 Transcript_29148/m.68223 type:complete len:270 (+) Transcript_29148:719-1528(+)